MLPLTSLCRFNQLKSVSRSGDDHPLSSILRLAVAAMRTCSAAIRAWIAEALGAETFEDSASVFLEIRSHEQSGVIRRDRQDGAIRFWIVKPGGLLQ
jgi:hypothetical protein